MRQNLLTCLIRKTEDSSEGRVIWCQVCLITRMSNNWTQQRVMKKPGMEVQWLLATDEEQDGGKESVVCGI